LAIARNGIKTLAKKKISDGVILFEPITCYSVDLYYKTKSAREHHIGRIFI